MRYNLDIIKHSKIWLVISGFMALIALVSLLVRGLNYGIDFMGGTIMDVKFDKVVTTGQVRDALKNKGLDDAVIRETELVGTGGSEFIITTRPLTEEQRRDVVSEMEKALGKTAVLSVDNVTPVVGAELKKDALLGIVLATLGMLIYITIRFEWRFGLAAVIALLHDVFLTVGFFSLLQIPVDTAFIAAILTVFGYSINDTIVVFDRVRENLAARKKDSLESLVNTSINEVLVRSINTVVTTLLAIIAVYLFGGKTLKDLALALTVGIAFGAYSSIFVASPVYVLINRMRLGKKGARTAAPRTA